ncbi:hypothetical protein ZIOFF_066921 [Zingiber officinale]|uniref:Uncharacterized protein n=1 Tax=Zingiber officinale TaxID=94328 RepID=A0A8J5EDM5_ZINOF|nr:hypothetical protein ZIOFF_066921 [Zingiber officinale]
MQQFGPENTAMTFDEVSLERSKGFVQALQELKSLRPQLYSAADYCEKTYLHSEQKQMVLDNLKEYAIRALVNAIDHLGSVAYKLAEVSEQQSSDISTVELKISCLSQVPSINGWRAFQTYKKITVRVRVDNSRAQNVTMNSFHPLEEHAAPLPLSSHLQAARGNDAAAVPTHPTSVKWKQDEMVATTTLSGFKLFDKSVRQDINHAPRSKSIFSAFFPRNKNVKPKRVPVS